MVPRGVARRHYHTAAAGSRQTRHRTPSDVIRRHQASLDISIRHRAASDIRRRHRTGIQGIRSERGVPSSIRHPQTSFSIGRTVTRSCGPSREAPNVQQSISPRVTWNAIASVHRAAPPAILPQLDHYTILMLNLDRYRMLKAFYLPIPCFLFRLQAHLNVGCCF